MKVVVGVGKHSGYQPPCKCVDSVAVIRLVVVTRNQLHERWQALAIFPLDKFVDQIPVVVLQVRTLLIKGGSPVREKAIETWATRV
jgi:hypothetical protein